MKILHIQYSMPPSGNACFRLHSEMCKRGIHSSVLNIERSIAVRNNVYSLKIDLSTIINKFFNKIQAKCIKTQLVPNTYFFSYSPLFGPKLSKEKIVQEANVIYFHWVAGGCLKFDEIKKMAKQGKLIIFFMHDMWDFTGGCHHSFDCRAYVNGCKKCPMFNSNSRIAAKQLSEKKSLFSKYSNIIFISPSSWMADCAKQSFALRNSQVYVINNVVDETIFRPIGKNVARDILNLPQGKKIITFGCQAGTKNKFKGWDYLREAMKLIKRDDLHIIIYGVDYQKDTQEQIDYPITFMGPIFDETKLALVCNATDIFVSPSLAESFGLTFLENILCNTPVVGFDNTAVGEIVKTDLNGYLAKNKDSKDLAYGISKLLNESMDVKHGGYSSSKIIDQHIKLIDKYWIK